MTCPIPVPDYAVLITPIGDGRSFELRIRELLVNVRTADLAEGWRLMQERKQEVIDCALAAGLIEEMPPALPLPPPV
jgi:hypothetical protein